MTFVEFLYQTVPGRLLLKPLTAPAVSALAGRLLDRPLSRALIPGFIRANHIRMEDYIQTDYKSFNDFFCRRIRPSLRPVDKAPDHLIAPCDGYLSVYPIRKDTVLPVKQSSYTIPSLLGNESLAQHFEDGFCLVFRLCVHHYHRYCYPDDAVKSENTTIPGIFHTVRPAALREFPVFVENTREYCLLDTAHFGKMIQMEVGAMLVGRICNLHGERSVERGEEKGFFEYGGSTIILLVEKDQVIFPPKLIDCTEVPVRMGQRIARKI